MRTLKRIGIVGGAIALLFSTTTAFAEELPRPTAAQVKSGIRPLVSSTTRAELKADAQERMEAARADAKARMEAARTDAKARMTAQREKAAKRLAEVQDKIKQQTAERIAEQFGKTNEKWTNHFLQLLERYDAIMEKIQERASIAASAGNDVTGVTSAIQSATDAIANARTLVVAQAAKTYVLDASTVTTVFATTTPNGQAELIKSLRSSFQTMHKNLFKDLFALRDGAMADARKAMQNAHQALSAIPSVDEDEDDDEENATSTSSSNQ